MAQVPAGPAGAVLPEPPPDTLDGFEALLWQKLGRAVRDRRSPWHTPVMATLGTDGWPKARTLVLRAADRGRAPFRVHSDGRGAKAAEIDAEPRVTLHFYDAGARLQLRVEGLARVDREGPDAGAAWAAATLFARRCYLAPVAPGVPCDAPTSGLPAELERREPTPDESEAGRPNFAVILVEARRLEFLHLAVTGHRRGQFVRLADGWKGGWLVP